MRAAILILVLMVVIVFAGEIPALAGDENEFSYNAGQAPCQDCHLCAQPTETSPCLKSCPESTGFRPASHRSDEGPQTVFLGEPGSLYGPVMFDHRRHAEMGSMGSGCSSCHHYNPPGHVPACSNCHTQPTRLGQPGLKGAYHRQCLGCHKQWSGSTDCASCHLPNESASIGVPVNSSGQRDLMHNTAVKPVKKIYDVLNKNGEKVTFYHNDHVDKFGVDCVTCHKRESCGYCHDPNGASVPVKSAEEIHAICNDCHDGDNCKLCHGKQEKSPFTHDASHWRLGEYHRHLPCRSCHEVGQRIKSLKADCSECHANWGPDNFDHRLTSLELDDTHRELDCADCHPQKKYHQPPTCTDCHEEDRSPQTTPPGVILSGVFGNNTTLKEVH